MSCIQVEDVCRKRGETYAYVITLTQGGVPVVITGDSFALDIHSIEEPVDATTRVISAAIAGTILDGGLTGRVSFTHADLGTLGVGNYFYGIQWTDAGLVREVLEGKWDVEQDRTK